METVVPPAVSGQLSDRLIPSILRADVEQGRSANELSAVLVSALDEVLEGQTETREAQLARFTVAGRVGRYELLKQEGGCVPSAEAAQLYLGNNAAKSPNPETVRKAARELRLISVRDGHGDILFPVWQFAEGGGALPELGRVLKALAKRPGYSDITPFRFFLQHHPRTSGRPLDALRAGRTDDVVAAAVSESD